MAILVCTERRLKIGATQKHKGKSGMKYVYTFGGKTAEGNAQDKNLLGGKGQIWRRWSSGLPVPAGFLCSTGVLHGLFLLRVGSFGWFGSSVRLT